MQIPQKIRRLNDRLRQELGSNPYGEGKWQWRHGSTLVLRVPDPYASPFEGEWKADASTGILFRQPPIREISQVPEYKDSWVVCYWEYFAPDQWFAFTKANTDFPAKGVWCPTGFHDEDPDDFINHLFIQGMKRIRSKSTEDRIAEDEKRMEAKERSLRSERKAMIQDLLPAYDIPGTKGYASHGGIGESKLFIAKSDERKTDAA